MCGIVGFCGDKQAAPICWMGCLSWNIVAMILPV